MDITPRGRVDFDGPPFPIHLRPTPAPAAPVPAAPVVKHAPVAKQERARLPTAIRAVEADDVAKSKRKEEPTLRMVKTLQGLAPASPYDQELLAEVGHGKEVEVRIHQERSVPHHRLYWALLHTLVANSEGRYLRATDLHEALKISLGVTRRITLITPSPHAVIAIKIRTRLAQCLMWIAGLLANVPMANKITDAISDSIRDLKELETDCDTILLPGSTGFWSMDQREFRVYFDSACDQLRKAGYDVDAAIEHTKQQIGTRYRPVGQSYQPERDHVHQEAAGTESADSEIDRDSGADQHVPLQERS